MTPHDQLAKLRECADTLQRTGYPVAALAAMLTADLLATLLQVADPVPAEVGKRGESLVPVNCYDCNEPMGTGDPAKVYRHSGGAEEEACRERVADERDREAVLERLDTAEGERDAAWAVLADIVAATKIVDQLTPAASGHERASAKSDRDYHIDRARTLLAKRNDTATALLSGAKGEEPKP